MNKSLSYLTVFLLISLALDSCSMQPNLYVLAKNDDRKSLLEQGQYRKFIFIHSDYSPDLRAIMIWLDRKNRKRAKELTETLTNNDEKTFALGLLSFTAKNYREALEYFNKIPKEKLHGQPALLVLDCTQELGIKRNYYQEYQEIYDGVHDPVMKEIIETRFRFFKHAL